MATNTNGRPKTISPAMTYNQRLEYWQGNTCPYCGCGKVAHTMTNRNGIHYRCLDPDCKAENHFSRGRRKPARD